MWVTILVVQNEESFVYGPFETEDQAIKERDIMIEEIKKASENAEVKVTPSIIPNDVFIDDEDSDSDNTEIWVREVVDGLSQQEVKP